MQSDLAELSIANDWFSLSHDRFAWQQLIGPVHTYMEFNPDWQLFAGDDDDNGTATDIQ